jgi:DNA polymerase III epsilon subunit-like protein
MIVVDGEFSGLVPHTCSILSLAALEFEKPDNRFVMECCVWDGAHINDESIEYAGFTREEATDPNKPTEGELVRNFLGWAETVGERTLAGQNVSFDRMFLLNAAAREHLDFQIAYKVVDTHTLGYMHMVKRGLTPPIKNNRSALDLDALLNYVGIPEEPKPHIALNGAISHAEVVSRLLYDKKLLPEFEQYDIPWH